MSDTRPKHGGDLDVAARRFGIDRASWLDLSTGLNRQAYPVPQLDEAVWRSLPNEAEIATLEEAARVFYGAGEHASVLAAAGSAVLIHRLPALTAKGRVHIAGPTFAEHQAAWTLAGHEVRIVDGLDYAGADVLVVVNPNNPGGEAYPRRDVLAAGEALAARGGLLVVDEAFADAHPELSVAADAGRGGLVVLRSFGKFFGLAGLRLGFALGPEPLITGLRAAAGPWPVSAPAVRIGRAAFADTGWAEETRARLGQASRRLQVLLAGHGLSVAGVAALFVLIEDARAAALHEGLARQGVWTRSFPGHPNRLRIGLPGGEAEWQRFEAALRAALQ